MNTLSNLTPFLKAIYWGSTYFLEAEGGLTNAFEFVRRELIVLCVLLLAEQLQIGTIRLEETSGRSSSLC